MNILDPILFHCRHAPNAMAICAPGFDLITYVDLQKKIISVARCAKAAGLSPG
jgi:hypothetical protein